MIRPERVRRLKEILQIINDYDYDGTGWTMSKTGWLLFEDLPVQQFKEFCIHPNISLRHGGCDDCDLNGCQIDSRTICNVQGKIIDRLAVF